MWELIPAGNDAKELLGGVCDSLIDIFTIFLPSNYFPKAKYFVKTSRGENNFVMSYFF